MSNSWYQQALTPPDVIEARMRVGVIPETDHVQVLVELHDPLTGVLIATESWPHTNTRDLRRCVEEATRRMVDLLDVHLEAF